MAQTKAIPQARQAMLDLIKSKINSTNAKANRTINSSSTETTSKRKKNAYIDIARQNQFKRELDEQRRPANTVRLYGKVI